MHQIKNIWVYQNTSQKSYCMWLKPFVSYLEEQKWVPSRDMLEWPRMFTILPSKEYGAAFRRAALLLSGMLRLEILGLLMQSGSSSHSFWDYASYFSNIGIHTHTRRGLKDPKIIRLASLSPCLRLASLPSVLIKGKWRLSVKRVNGSSSMIPWIGKISVWISPLNRPWNLYSGTGVKPICGFLCCSEVICQNAFSYWIYETSLYCFEGRNERSWVSSLHTLESGSLCTAPSTIILYTVSFRHANFTRFAVSYPGPQREKFTGDVWGLNACPLPLPPPSISLLLL